MGGDDTLSIMSFNSARKGYLGMSDTTRSHYVENVLNDTEPDICFMPGDDPTIGTNVVLGYQQYKTPTSGDTVLLYDTNRVTMTDSNVNFNGFGPLPGLDFSQMVCPAVTVSASNPSRVVKEFSMVSWKYTFFHQSPVTVETLTESIIRFSQRLSCQTGKPTLISGEITLDYNTLAKIVNKLGRDSQEMFLSEIQPEMTEHAYLPSMTKSSFRPVRHLFMMKVFRCDSSMTSREADCFIASKSLELSEAKLFEVDNMFGRGIKLSASSSSKPTSKPASTPTYSPNTETYSHCRPTQTNMTIPARPPKHHGG